MARNLYAAAERPHALAGLPGVALTLLRVFAALLVMQHGAQKVFGLFGGFGGTGRPAPLLSQHGIAGMVELAGGLLVAFGLFTRPVALILSGELAVAYFLRHAPGGFSPLENGGEPTALLSFVFLLFAAFGRTPYSIDARRTGRRRR